MKVFLPLERLLACPIATSILFKKESKERANSTYPEVGGLRVELIFNKNVIKPGDNKEYIKEAADTIVILYIK